MRLNIRINILLVLFISLLVDCSSFKMFNSFENSFMPLSVGNKWYYTLFPSSEYVETKHIIMEVVSIDTIKRKQYSRIEYKSVRSDTTILYYYHLRLSNDTLFSMNYDTQRKIYNERVDAIFSLQSNEQASIHLNIDSSEPKSGKEIEKLPVSNNYKIKVLNKNEDKVEFLIDDGNPDMQITTVYKKGVGIVKTISSWGGGIELEDYDFE